MKLLVRLAIFAATLALGGASLSLAYASPHSTVAGGSAETISCSGFPSGDCTVTVNEDVDVGQTFQMLFPDQTTPMVVTCANGCFSGETFVVHVTQDMLANGFDTFVTPTCPGSCQQVEVVVAATPAYIGS